MRRCRWANTRLGEDGFEYSGAAKELLIGFLAALAALAPLHVASFLIGIEAERLQAFASVPLGLLLVVLGPFAAPRSRGEPA
ncbi:hypothetical protein GCM10007036_10020 [Alsobacter metallidurans]|uniref:Uncharacterized protein n=1 Tax=Alsobacter metallidurans TaxID=340221 RepID=A0A917I5F0_9HYPH|nr:DUF898 family protein [Alsobacter metallidurans]GGH12310.1 hypothetical protein GCM10007036_10020 [Alsobacter metallidurans]